MMVSHLPVFAAIALLCAIAWHDMRALKVRNKAVLALLVLYALHMILAGFAGLGGDLIAGGLLFAIGFVMWLARGMGAGDVKLMLPIGLFTGYLALPIFAVLLMLVSVAMYVAIRIAVWRDGQGGAARRFQQMKSEGKVPYAVPLVVAAVPSILLGLYGPS